MKDTISIYDAKTQLSKLVKRANQGETIYIGAYGQAQAILAPLPKKKPLKIGLYAHKKIENAYNYDDLVSSDPDIVADFEASINRPFP